MGAVYLAVDTQLGRQVALKIPFFDAKEEPKRLERFLREARSAARLHHPNICTIHDVGQHQGQPYITMAFITGKPLDELFDSEDLLPIKTSVNIVRRMALALQKAHELNIVHRDLKPANVMITPDGEPVIMDFGLAKLVGETDAAEARLTQDGAILGTPKYMAPEQVAGDQSSIGPPTDVYALGVILFELLTGRTPFSGPILQLLSQIASAPAPLVRSQRPEIQDALEVICQKALAKRPEDRFSSMNELAEALSAVDDAAAPKKRIRKEQSAEDIVLQDEVLIPQIDTGSSTRTSRRRNSGAPSSADARRKANTLGRQRSSR